MDGEIDDAPLDDEIRSEIEGTSVERAVTALSEHFDSVQVFVSRFDPESGLTVSYSIGNGNWHARVGHVRSWLAKGEEGERCEARRANAELHEDDDE